MKTDMTFSSDIAFTPTVKSIQDRKKSRANYARMEQGGSWQTHVTPELKSFVEAQTSFFLGTANADGQPYIQHRGGPAGFLKVMDSQNAWLCRLRREPPIYLARKSRG